MGTWSGWGSGVQSVGGKDVSLGSEGRCGTDRYEGLGEEVGWQGAVPSRIGVVSAWGCMNWEGQGRKGGCCLTLGPWWLAPH